MVILSRIFYRVLRNGLLFPSSGEVWDHAACQRSHRLAVLLAGPMGNQFKLPPTVQKDTQSYYTIEQAFGLFLWSNKGKLKQE